MRTTGKGAEVDWDALLVAVEELDEEESFLQSTGLLAMKFIIIVKWEVVPPKPASVQAVSKALTASFSLADGQSSDRYDLTFDASLQQRLFWSAGCSNLL